MKKIEKMTYTEIVNYCKKLKLEARYRIAQETLDIFAPLANRLGVGKIKAELEDLSLKYLYPDKYYEIAKLVSQKKVERETTVKLLIENLKHDVQKIDKII